MTYFWILKKVHWSDCDAAGVVWFPNFLGWYEDAEEELFSSLGRPRQQLLDTLGFGMPRVEAQVKFHSPVRAGQMVRIGLSSRVENPRRIRHEFQMREDGADRLIATGFVRVACVDRASFQPRDLPLEVTEAIGRLPELIAQQARGEVEPPWT